MTAAQQVGYECSYVITYGDRLYDFAKFTNAKQSETLHAILFPENLSLEVQKIHSFINP
jgi:hypothetical protein